MKMMGLLTIEIFLLEHIMVMQEGIRKRSYSVSHVHAVQIRPLKESSKHNIDLCITMLPAYHQA